MSQGFVRQPKFLRLLHFGTIENLDDAEQMYGRILKVFYEFWGFCVNGGNDLTGAFGFPTGSFHDFSGNFESGSLLLSGSDGETVGGFPFFSSSVSDFTTLTGTVPQSGLQHKVLVTWQSGSSSTDDSIYRILKVESSGVLQVDPSTGGTPWTGSQNPGLPSFTDRSNVNYRVCDLIDTTDTITFNSGNHMVMQFDGAPVVNQGQDKSQLRFGIRPNSIEYVLSPSGSWNGSEFSDPSLGYWPQGGADGQNSGEWGGMGSGLTARDEILLTLVGTPGFFFLWLSGQTSTGAAGIHAEIPERLYPQDKDPNPITAMGWYRTGLSTTSNLHGYGAGFRIQDQNATTIRHFMIVKSPTNDHFDEAFTSDDLNTPSPRYYGSFYDVHNDRIWFSEGLLWNNDSTQSFTLARCRIRGVRFVPRIIPNNTLIGEAGNQWLHITNSILLPWDGAILKRPLNILGGG
jgi:hypothetical protein